MRNGPTDLPESPSGFAEGIGIGGIKGDFQNFPPFRGKGFRAVKHFFGRNPAQDSDEACPFESFRKFHVPVL